VAKIKIEITSKAVGDAYARSHGKTVDKDLNLDFWASQRGSVIGVASGSFSHSQEVDLEPGSHYVEYGVSAWVGYWEATIKANGITIAEGDVYIKEKKYYLRGEFFVIPFPPYVVPIKLPLPPFESPLATLNNMAMYLVAPFKLMTKE